MAVQKRIALTVSPEHHEILKKLGEFQNKPVTTIVHEFVEACMPMAQEMVNYSKNNILAQAGQSMLAQANQANQGVLSLLG